MAEERLAFLGEEDYLAAMHGECRAWREAAVREGELTAPDGTRLRYYCASPERPRAAVLMIHGLCEFFGKYHELAWYLWRAGYAFYFLEQRGHGYSGGKLPEPDADVIHVEHYDRYVEDQRAFLDAVVLPECGDLPLLIYSHSMGGAIASLLLEELPDRFRAAFLSSPMLRLKAAHPTLLTLSLVRLFVKIFRKGTSLAPGEHHFSPEPNFNNPNGSRAHYDYLFSQRVADRHYQTCCASMSWVLASIRAIRKLQRKAHGIRVPVFMFGAGNDRLVDPVGHEFFVRRVPQTEYILYPKSEHEIYNACDEIRKTYFSDLFRQLRRAVDGI